MAFLSPATGLDLSLATQSQRGWSMMKWPSWTKKPTVRADSKSTETTGSARNDNVPNHSSNL